MPFVVDGMALVDGERFRDFVGKRGQSRMAPR
jgi:hypothetical protein